MADEQPLRVPRLGSKADLIERWQLDDTEPQPQRRLGLGIGVEAQPFTCILYYGDLRPNVVLTWLKDKRYKITSENIPTNNLRITVNVIVDEQFAGDNTEGMGTGVSASAYIAWDRVLPSNVLRRGVFTSAGGVPSRVSREKIPSHRVRRTLQPATQMRIREEESAEKRKRANERTDALFVRYENEDEDEGADVERAVFMVDFARLEYAGEMSIDARQGVLEQRIAADIRARTTGAAAATRTRVRGIEISANLLRKLYGTKDIPRKLREAVAFWSDNSPVSQLPRISAALDLFAMQPLVSTAAIEKEVAESARLLEENERLLAENEDNTVAEARSELAGQIQDAFEAFNEAIGTQGELEAKRLLRQEIDEMYPKSAFGRLATRKRLRDDALEAEVQVAVMLVEEDIAEWTIGRKLTDADIGEIQRELTEKMVTPMEVAAEGVDVDERHITLAGEIERVLASLPARGRDKEVEKYIRAYVGRDVFARMQKRFGSSLEIGARRILYTRLDEDRVGRLVPVESPLIHFIRLHGDANGVRIQVQDALKKYAGTTFFDITHVNVNENEPLEDTELLLFPTIEIVRIEATGARWFNVVVHTQLDFPVPKVVQFGARYDLERKSIWRTLLINAIQHVATGGYRQLLSRVTTTTTTTTTTRNRNRVHDDALVTGSTQMRKLIFVTPLLLRKLGLDMYYFRRALSPGVASEWFIDLLQPGEIEEIDEGAGVGGGGAAAAEERTILEDWLEFFAELGVNDLPESALQTAWRILRFTNTFEFSNREFKDVPQFRKLEDAKTKLEGAKDALQEAQSEESQAREGVQEGDITPATQLVAIRAARMKTRAAREANRKVEEEVAISESVVVQRAIKLAEETMLRIFDDAGDRMNNVAHPLARVLHLRNTTDFHMHLSPGTKQKVEYGEWSALFFPPYFL